MDGIPEQEEVNLTKPTIIEKYFSRFLNLLQFNDALAIILIKSWLKEPSNKTNLALQAIGQNLDEEKMAQIFEKLSSLERQKWKESIKKHLSTEDIKEASIYISEEITRELLSNNANYDVEFFDLIGNCTSEHLINFFKKYPKQIAPAFNLLPPSLVAKILDKIPKEEAFHYIEQSFTSKNTKDEKTYHALKNDLKKFLGEIKNKPFTSKLIEMLPTFNPFKESIIYESLFQTVSETEIIKAARENFPYLLFSSLPSEIIRGSLKSYHEKERLHFFASVSEEERDFYIDAFAAKGTPLRDMVEIGLSEITNNEVLKRQLEQSKEENIKRYIRHLREFLNSSPSFALIIHEIVETWAHQHTKQAGNLLKFPNR